MSLRSESNELIEKAKNLYKTHQDIKDQYMSEWPRKKVKVKNRDEMYEEIKDIVSKLDTTKSQLWDKRYKMEQELNKKQYIYDNLPERSKKDETNKSVIAYNKSKRLFEDISSIKDEVISYHYKLRSLKDEFLDRTEEDTRITFKINKG